MSVRCIKDYGIINSTHSDTYSALPTDRANVAAYDCPSSGANGKILVGVDISNPDNPVSQTITANVTKVGTYQINAVHKNISFSGTGTFTGTGSQTIILNAFPTSIYALEPLVKWFGTNKFYLQSISPSCVFERTYNYPESRGTAKITSFSSTVSYPGGVMTVGVPVSGVTQNVTASVPALSGTTTYDLTTNTIRGVKFTANGTFPSSGSSRNVTIQLIASGTPTEVKDSSDNIYTLNPSSYNNVLTSSQRHNFGRHIYETGTATFSTLTAGVSAGGTMPVGTIIPAGKTRTKRINVTVETIGTYNISATNNGVTFSRAGSFSATGSNFLLLEASGTPIAAGTFTFTTNTNPSVSFDITFQ